MNRFKILLSLLVLAMGLNVFSQGNSKEAITTEWEIISMGKLQKKPLFKDPMISVRFIFENNVKYLHISFKYMFTDAVFDEALPVEYYKNERMEVATDKEKYELKAVRYAKARRMSTVAQKTADMKVIFTGDLTFLGNELVKTFTVHFAQGYQHIKVNKEEAQHLQNAYNKFLGILPKATPATNKKTQSTRRPDPNLKEVDIDGGVSAGTKAKTDTIQSSGNSLDKARQQARKWRR